MILETAVGKSSNPKAQSEQRRAEKNTAHRITSTNSLLITPHLSLLHHHPLTTAYLVATPTSACGQQADTSLRVPALKACLVQALNITASHYPHW